MRAAVLAKDKNLEGGSIKKTKAPAAEVTGAMFTLTPKTHL